MEYTLLSGHAASPHQNALLSNVADPDGGSNIVNAVAGSGKTTVIKNAFRCIPEGRSVLGLAFNVDAANNLKAALEEVAEADGRERYRRFRMSNFHSLGYGAILRKLGRNVKCEPDPGKMRNLLKRKLTSEDYDNYSGFVLRLVGLAKGEGIGALVPDTEDRWYDIVEHHGLYLDSEDANESRGIEIARKALRCSNIAAERGEIDFDDQLYLVILWKLRLYRNDFVFVDEAQDTNPVRRAIIALALEPGGRVYAVGDPNQSIYGFTGATPDALELIRREFNCGELPLSVSFRCARAVVADAQRWVSRIEAASGAEEGVVKHNTPLSEALRVLTPRDAVLCRQTAPLVALAYKLISENRGCRVLGKDIGNGLVSLVRAQKARGVEKLIEKLENWREREMARAAAKGDEVRAEAIADRVACVLTIVGTLSERERTIPALEKKIQALFEDKIAGVLTLATVHRMKGQEYDNVAILSPHLMPSKAARQDWQIQQEENLQYVAATRARRCLMYLDE